MAGSAGRAFADVRFEVPARPKEQAPSVSFDDHFSQARLFWTSMSATEQDHIIGAYSFELGKCRNPQVRRRQLECLARIDPVLCREVSQNLGLEPPRSDESLADVRPSEALSQLGGRWPVKGRTIGIVVDASDASYVAATVDLVQAAGMMPRVVAAVGGEVAGVQVDETFATARSVQFDALLVLGMPLAPLDSRSTRHGKAGAAEVAVLDPRVRQLVEESWRHAKVMGAVGAGTEVLLGTGVRDSIGVVIAHDLDSVLSGVSDCLASHRVWERFGTRREWQPTK